MQPSFLVIRYWHLVQLTIPPSLTPFFFFLNDPAPPESSPLPLHAPLPIKNRPDFIGAETQQSVPGAPAKRHFQPRAVLELRHRRLALSPEGQRTVRGENEHQPHQIFRLSQASAGSKFWPIVSNHRHRSPFRNLSRTGAAPLRVPRAR